MMQPDPSLDTTHATVHPGSGAAPSPHGTHQAAPPQAFQAGPKGEQAAGGPAGHPQVEQAGLQAEKQAGEQASGPPASGSIKAGPPQAPGSEQQAEEQQEQGGQMVVVTPAHPASAEEHLLALAAPPARDETYQPTTIEPAGQHVYPADNNQPGHQGTTTTHQAAVNQTCATAELTKAPGTPGVYDDGVAPGAHPSSGEAYGT